MTHKQEVLEAYRTRCQRCHASAKLVGMRHSYIRAGNVCINRKECDKRRSNLK